MRLDPVDDGRYRRLVTPLVPAIERLLGHGIVANRAAGPGGPSMLAPWRPARERWRRIIRDACTDVDRSTVVVATDVEDCYGSITPTVVGRALAAGTGATATAVTTFLAELDDRGVRGLPIGPEPSALLANAVLAEADAAVVAVGVQALRWVDDVVLIAPGELAATRAFDAWRRALGELGLRPQDRKTRRWRDPLEARDALLRRAGSASSHERMA